MKESGVKEEVIKDLKKRIRNYIPHKWYGNWAIVAKQEVVRPETELRTRVIEGVEEEYEIEVEKKGIETVFMTATNYTDRLIEKDRVRKLQ